MANIQESSTYIGSLPTRRVSSVVNASNNTTRKGLRFPFPKDQRYINTVVDLELAKMNLKQLLRTVPGERVMQPDFGCDLESLLFEPFDDTLVLQAREKVVYSISKFIPYLELVRVRVIRLEESSRFGLPTLLIQVTCRIKNQDNSNFNLDIKI